MKKTVRKKVAASRQAATEKAEDAAADDEVDEGAEHDEVREGVYVGWKERGKKKVFCRRRRRPCFLCLLLSFSFSSPMLICVPRPPRPYPTASVVKCAISHLSYINPLHTRRPLADSQVAALAPKAQSDEEGEIPRE